MRAAPAGIAHFLLPALAVVASALAGEPGCRIGAYRLGNGQVIDVGPSDGDALRWRAFAGDTGALHPQADGGWKSTYGWTDRPDSNTVSFSGCETGGMQFGAERGQRIAFDTTETVFDSHGVRLAGRLVLAKGTEPVPIVVLVHGSENSSAREFNSLQRLLPAAGVGAFVYDKRGTGGSSGTYTQDFSTLADDAVAAMREARRIAGARAGRLGYQGGSQAGWVVPLAANRANVDFAIVSFGLAVTVLEEDQQSVALDMHFHGHSAEDTRKALQLARAAELVIESKGARGYSAFDALRTRYKSEAWYKDVHGDFMFAILPLNQDQIRKFIATQFDFGTPFRYQPMPALRASTTPQLWVLGGHDLEAPSAETSRRIRSLISTGKPYTLAIYPTAEHGMTEYELNPHGERVSTRFAAGYFAMMRDFARDGRIGDDYGDAQIAKPAQH